MELFGGGRFFFYARRRSEIMPLEWPVVGAASKGKSFLLDLTGRDIYVTDKCK